MNFLKRQPMKLHCDGSVKANTFVTDIVDPFDMETLLFFFTKSIERIRSDELVL